MCIAEHMSTADTSRCLCCSPSAFFSLCIARRSRHRVTARFAVAAGPSSHGSLDSLLLCASLSADDRPRNRLACVYAFGLPCAQIRAGTSILDFSPTNTGGSSLCLAPISPMQVACVCCPLLICDSAASGWHRQPLVYDRRSLRVVCALPYSVATSANIRVHTQQQQPALECRAQNHRCGAVLQLRPLHPHAVCSLLVQLQQHRCHDT